MRRGPALGTAVLVMAFALAGCSSGGTVQEATQEYCTALSDVSAEVEQMRDLAASDATVAEFDDQRMQLREAQDALQEQRSDVKDALNDRIDDLRGSFEDAVDQIPGDATLSEAAAAYQDAAQEYLEGLQDLFTESGC
jgi:hypothetical protein